VGAAIRVAGGAAIGTTCGAAVRIDCCGRCWAGGGLSRRLVFWGF